MMVSFAGHHFPDVAQVFCLVLPAATRGGNSSILSLADGPPRHHGGRGTTRLLRLSGDPDRAALSRHSFQYGIAGGRDDRRDADGGDRRGDVPAAPPFPRTRRADR